MDKKHLKEFFSSPAELGEKTKKIPVERGFDDNDSNAKDTG